MTLTLSTMKSTLYKLVLIFLVGISCNAPTTQPNSPSSDPDRPNILVILTDDQGYGDVTAFGAPDLQTPYTDRLISMGMRFNQFYANCPVCSPTRAALLSGRYQEYVGVPGVIRTHANNSWGFLDTTAVMLPEILQENGYHTALVGKWHLGLESPNTPNERGFDLFHGWLGDMMDDYVAKRRHDINYMRHNQETIDPPGHATDIFTQWAQEYIQSRKGQEEPFFLYTSPTMPLIFPSNLQKIGYSV